MLKNRSVAVSILAVGAMFGGLLSGWFADRFGRKRTLLFNNINAFIGAAFIVSAKPIGIYYLVTFGRFITGINAGNVGGFDKIQMIKVKTGNKVQIKNSHFAN